MIDALERQPTVDDLRAKLKSAQSDLETERDWDMSQIFDPGDLQQRRAADLVNQAFALKDQLAQLKGQKEYGRTARRLDGVMEQIGNLHGKGIVAKATRDLLTAENANDIELGSLRDSITATLAIDRAQKELAAAEADLKLGLDDQELRQMGLGEDDVREIHATIGHLAKQGLRSSADVEQTAKAIRNGLALLERGMTQGTLGQLSNAIPESRANLLMDLVFQDVTRDHRNLSLTAESDEVREAFRRAMESLLIDRSSGQETVTAMQLRLHGSALQSGRGGIAEDSRRLMEADEANQAALAFHLIDRVSRDPTAKAIPAIPGDRCMVNTQNPAHFVAFRKDTAGEWWLIDSAPTASQKKMTPKPTSATSCRTRRTGSSR